MISKHDLLVYKILTQSYKGPWLGARHIFAFLGFLGFVNVYAMRVNLSVAIVAMVNQTDHGNSGGNQTNSSGTCPAPLIPTNSSSPDDNAHEGTFNWDEKTQSYVLGSFFYGYVLTQLPGTLHKISLTFITIFPF